MHHPLLRRIAQSACCLLVTSDLFGAMSDHLGPIPEFTDRSLLLTHQPILRPDIQSSNMFAPAQCLIPPALIDLPLLIEAILTSLKCTLDKYYQLVSSSKSEIQQSPHFL